MLRQARVSRYARGPLQISTAHVCAGALAAELLDPDGGTVPFTQRLMEFSCIDGFILSDELLVSHLAWAIEMLPVAPGGHMLPLGTSQERTLIVAFLLALYSKCFHGAAPPRA